jgi:hypothetical protein
LGEGEGNMTNRWNAINGGASDWLTHRSHRPCACGDVFYAQLGRSSGLVGHVLSYTLRGSHVTKPLMIDHWKSDSLIVVRKHANKLGSSPRRSVWSEGDWQRGNVFSRRLAVTQSMRYLASGLEMLGKVTKQYKFIQRFHLWLDVGAVCVSSARTGYRVRICAGGLI